ncbi:DUF1002 domain-containing protein (plasmid) [Staphylococcus aureus]|uniref:DUF1002 domain-containing protein n=1 Tax=Staphylococcus aureus TaxID=1280 RepID=UPI000BA650B2|nr:DUF1002 domain-containing protein [Staphylococcus aureus]EHS7180689.1 DUF1002 domain-containing protein [Staphylococcus pseudintermedius]PAJ50112.1 hypothetical protein APW25_11710 [Staphylococcus aureus]ULW18148.1 DUF1002 domain-containing protein [Staphylococcus aureus]BBL19078.1 hypothetical protein SAJRA307_P0300 [Staphylococcus aureus]HAR6425146.1 DUF1002 domain-containing protein [Staphylococcus pseudintermedius]
MKAKKLATVTIAMGLILTSNVHAQPNNSSNEEWKKPIFIEGADLQEEKHTETEQKLNVKSDYERFKVNVDDVAKYVPSSSNLNYIYSSATIEKKHFGSGVKVEIKTPENITKVTSDQYRNAAITAGIKNANIKIASISPVTGEGALAGIYKAYAMKNNDLDEQDIQNANEEMKNLSNISEENRGEKGYSDEALNASISEIKTQLAEIRSKQDRQLTQDDVKQTVNEVLAERGLDKIINDNQRQLIINNMNNVANSNALNNDPEAFKKQAKDLTHSIQNQAGDKINKAKEFVNSDEGRNLFQKILDGIMEIINHIIEFVKSLF